MNEFRPISCCNVCYKVISKIIANRIKVFLPHLVDENQSAFIQGRCIQDNILLMHNLVKSYQKIRGPSCCAIKVDIMKAFDTVNWDYLMSILTQMNFPHRFRNWIYLCISTSSYSINLNESLTGHFKASRGLRQGDPLSPILFILAMEGFTQLLKSNTQILPFKFHPKCDSTRISSLAFADDLFILASADIPTINTIQTTLTTFGRLSGLTPNKNKCEIFISGVPPAKKGPLLRF